MLQRQLNQTGCGFGKPRPLIRQPSWTPQTGRPTPHPWAVLRSLRRATLCRRKSKSGFFGITESSSWSSWIHLRGFNLFLEKMLEEAIWTASSPFLKTKNETEWCWTLGLPMVWKSQRPGGSGLWLQHSSSSISSPSQVNRWCFSLKTSGSSTTPSRLASSGCCGMPLRCLSDQPRCSALDVLRSGCTSTIACTLHSIQWLWVTAMLWHMDRPLTLGSFCNLKLLSWETSSPWLVVLAVRALWEVWWLMIWCFCSAALQRISLQRRRVVWLWRLSGRPMMLQACPGMRERPYMARRRGLFGVFNWMEMSALLALCWAGAFLWFGSLQRLWGFNIAQFHSWRSSPGLWFQFFNAGGDSWASSMRSTLPREVGPRRPSFGFLLPCSRSYSVLVPSLLSALLISSCCRLTVWWLRIPLAWRRQQFAVTFPRMRSWSSRSTLCRKDCGTGFFPMTKPTWSRRVCWMKMMSSLTNPMLCTLPLRRLRQLSSSSRLGRCEYGRVGDTST